MHVYICICMCIYVCVYIHVCTCMCIYVYACVYMYMCVSIYIYMYVYACVYMYTCIYIYIKYGYSLIKSLLQCLSTCHRILRSCARFTEVVHISQKVCTFHAAPLIPFVFNRGGLDGCHWGLLTRLSRYIYIYINIEIYI